MEASSLCCRRSYFLVSRIVGLPPSPVRATISCGAEEACLIEYTALLVLLLVCGDSIKDGIFSSSFP